MITKSWRLSAVLLVGASLQLAFALKTASADDFLNAVGEALGTAAGTAISQGAEGVGSGVNLVAAGNKDATITQTVTVGPNGSVMNLVTGEEATARTSLATASGSDGGTVEQTVTVNGTVLNLASGTKSSSVIEMGRAGR